MATRALFAAMVALAAVAQPAASSAASFEPEAAVRRVDRVAILALAHAGTRTVAAGERGRILVSDDEGATWKVAITPTFQTLTSLYFSNPTTGFATGHQGVLLRTQDGGLTWKEAVVDTKDKQAFFAVRVVGEKGIAVGAYGACVETSDGGKTWATRKVLETDFDKHLTGIAAIGPGRMLVAGEAGTLFLASDDGSKWQQLKSPYEGSFFGAIGLTGGNVIAFGMRGNAWRSGDAGKTWQRVELGGYTGALQGATELADGTVVLVGADGMIAVSHDGGATFVTKPLPSRALLVAALPSAGGWLVAGPAGLHAVR